MMTCLELVPLVMTWGVLAWLALDLADVRRRLARLEKK